MLSIQAVQEKVAAQLARVRGTSNHRVCPMCDDQGELVEATASTGERVLICDECDALWAHGAPVSENSAEDFADFMERRGKAGLWTELIIAP